MTQNPLVIDPKASLPDIVDGYRPWKQAFAYWQNKMPANTARAYLQAWKSLLAFAGKDPWDIQREDISGWVDAMISRGISASTIQQRLAGISKFYQYLNETTGMNVDNPAAGKSLRPKRTQYQGARYLNADQVRQLLAAISPETAQGSRDFALFLAYLFCGRRNSEIRQLKWGDIDSENFRIYYRWEGKGKSRRDEMPRPVFLAISNYLTATGRLETIRANEFVFIALSDNAKNLPNVCAQTFNEKQPISMHQVQNLLKMYCERANLPAVRVHDLRHTAAMLRKTVGDDVEKIRDFLNHSSLAVTQVYLHDIEGRADDSWQTVEKLLGIGKKDRIHKSNIRKSGAHGKK